MVPMVNAADANSAYAVDVSNLQLPQLQFDSSQTKVIVTQELSPSQNVQSSQVTANLVASKNPTVSTIPYGSIIYHSDNGVTTVFDSTGKQLFAADDAKSIKVSTPHGESPATFVHEVPSGSFSKEVDGKTYIFYKGNLILTIINGNDQRSIKTDIKNIADSRTDGGVAINSALLSNYLGWIEYSESTSATVERFESTWVAPLATPTNSGVRESVAIWNGIERTGVDGVMQPVLMWNFCPYGDTQIHNNYVGAAWDYHTISSPNKDSLHSTPISVSPGDTVRGTLQWSSTYSCWLIQFNNIRTGQTTAYYTTRFPRDNLKLYMTLEASGAGIKPNNNSLTGSITFNNIIVQNQGVTVPVTFTGHIWPGASSSFTGLEAVVSTNPQLQIFLRTGR